MIEGKRVIALVPMKAHSARVPDKNIRSFSAEPLYFSILHTLDTVPEIDEVVINTDSQRIAREAPRHFEKVRIIDRPQSLTGNDVSMNRVIEHDLTIEPADVYLQTHSTNPLLSKKTIAQALGMFVGQSEHDSLFGVNVYQSRFYRGSGEPVNHDPTNLLPTQDLLPMYEENSCLYLFTRESFKKTHTRIGEQPMMFVVPRIEAIDIDDHETWHLAEVIATGLRSIARPK